MADVAKVTLLHSHLDEDHALRMQMLGALVEETQMERIRILDADGVILASSSPQEVGEHAALPSVRPEAALDSASPVASTSTIRYHQGHRDLVTAEVLNNTEACQACHDPRIASLGTIVIETRMRSVRTLLMHSMWRALAISAMTFALLAVLLTFFLRRILVRPVLELGRSAAAVAEGNLDVPVAVASQDELGDLATVFETMRQGVKASMGEMEHRNQRLGALNEIEAQISASLNMRQISETAADGARRLLKADVGIVANWDQERAELLIDTAVGAHSETIRGRSLRLQQSLGNAPGLAETFTLADICAQSCHELEALGLTGLTAAPIHHEDRFLGAIGVMTQSRRRFMPEECALLTNLASLTAAALENARLFREVRQLAVLDEHRRLSQEMHDSLAQTLAYLNLKIATIMLHLSCDQMEFIQAELQEIRETVADTYTDVREAIFNLRKTVSAPSDIVAALREYLDAYHVHYGIHADLLLEDVESLQFRPDVTIQLLRIVQEALTNVRKHAEADRVSLLLQCEQETCRIVIDDNGRGWSPPTPDDTSRGHFGTQIMEERARSIGGRLWVESVPGQGTRVTVEFPIEAEEDIHGSELTPHSVG